MNHQTTSDTPETDALYKNDHRPNLIEHARKLERERDEARKLFESSKRARASLNEACDHLQRERDAQHAAIRNLRDVQGRYHTQIATERLFALLPESSSQPERR